MKEDIINYYKVSEKATIYLCELGYVGSLQIKDIKEYLEQKHNSTFALTLEDKVYTCVLSMDRYKFKISNLTKLGVVHRAIEECLQQLLGDFFSFESL